MPPGNGGRGHDGPAEEDRIDLNVPPARGGWVIAVGVFAVLILCALFLLGLLPRLHTSHELAVNAEEAADAPVPVNVVTPSRAPNVVQVRLPATLRPWQEVSLFARTTGYLKKYYVDISIQVTQGQLMADIDAPEVDAQLRGAQATLLQQRAALDKARTDLAFAKSTFERYQKLKDSATQQELDQYRSNANAGQANLESATANVAVGEAEVKRLSELQSFEKLIAPFSGVVTGRAYDVGAMILANPTTTDTQPLFKLAENDVLRAFIYVPQTDALMVKTGMQVNITARERPGRTFVGTVLGTTNYLDPSARTLMTEVRIPNPDLALLPGMYVDAAFEVKRDHPPLIIPAPSLIVNADGNQVGIVRDGAFHMQKVALGIDSGNEVEVVSGLTGDEQIVTNPGERLTEGVKVHVVNVTTQR
jgi:RND family efflux transporter MFP subunit